MLEKVQLREENAILLEKPIRHRANQQEAPDAQAPGCADARLLRTARDAPCVPIQHRGAAAGHHGVPVGTARELQLPTPRFAFREMI